MPRHVQDETPTTWLERFRDALGILCGGKPPVDLCQRWQDHVDNELQQWVGQHALAHMPSWCSAIGTIDAAESMANTPVEDPMHAPRPEAPADLAA